MAAAPITLSNFTGLDFNTILQAETAALQVPLTSLDNQLTGVNTAISTLGTISGDFTTLQNALSTLNTSLTIPPTAASVSSNAPFTATVAGAPENGTYNVTVSQLASAESLASQGYASDTSSVGDGTFTITIGGTVTPITVDSTNDTLDGLATAITTAGLGVSAQVVDTGAAGAPYQLEITSNSTGSAGAFSVTSSLSGGTSPNFATNSIGPTTSSVTGTSVPTVGGTYTGSLAQQYSFSVTSGGTLGTDPITIGWSSDSGESGTITVPANYSGQPLTVADGLTLTLGNGTLNTGDSFAAATFVPQVSTAQDATVQVGNQIVTSSSNLVTNAINGLTLALSGTGGPSVVTVSPDLTTEGGQVNSFVNAYNTVVNDITANTQAVPNQAAPPLADDASLKSVLSTLQTLLGTLNLSNLGISINQTTGLLTFDQTQFASAAGTNPSGTQTEIGQLYSALNSTISSVLTPDTGIIATETASDQTEVTQLNQQISTLTSENNQQITNLQTEYAQIQAEVLNYQNLAQMFDTSSSSSSSSTSTPGSTLSVTG
jgi:flagellar hook-associated protein 2